MAVVDTHAPPPPAPPPGHPAKGWSAGRIVSVVIGSILVVMAFAMMVAGTAGLAWNATQREDGYLTSATVALDSSGYAVTSDRVQVGSDAVDWGWQRWLIGDVRVRVTADDPSRPMFVGIGRSDDVARYLSGVAVSRVRNVDGRHVHYVDRTGTAPAAPPSAQSFWVASAAGTGRQTVTWSVEGGDWTVVVMNADASKVVAARADVGATVPALPWVAGGMLIAGLLLAGLGVVLIAVPLHRISREYPPVGQAVGPPWSGQPSGPPNGPPSGPPPSAPPQSGPAPSGPPQPSGPPSGP